MKKYLYACELALAICLILLTGCIGTITLDPISEAAMADMRALIPFCAIHNRLPTNSTELMDFATEGNVSIGMANGTNISFVTIDGQTKIAYDLIGPCTGHVVYSFEERISSGTNDPECPKELEEAWREQAGINKIMPNQAPHGICR